MSRPHLTAPPLAAKTSKPFKPYPEFPLFPRVTGQWTKPIQG